MLISKINIRLAIVMSALVLCSLVEPAFGIVINVPKKSKGKGKTPRVDTSFAIAGDSTAIVEPSTHSVRFTDMLLRTDDPVLGPLAMTLDPSRASIGTLRPLDNPRPFGLPSFPMQHTQDFYVVISAPALADVPLISNTPIRMQGTITSFTPENVHYVMLGEPAKFYKRGDPAQATVLTLSDIETDVPKVTTQSGSLAPSSSWYLAVYRFDDYDQTAAELLVQYTPQPIRGAEGSIIFPNFEAMHVHSNAQFGAGAARQLTQWLAIDVGMAVGSGTVSRTSRQPSVTQKIDYRLFSSSITAKLYPFPASRVLPWLSVGTRGLALRPSGGEETSVSQRFTSPSSHFTPVSSVDFVSGVGLDIEFTNRIGVTLGAENGFSTGWRVGGAVSVGIR